MKWRYPTLPATLTAIASLFLSYHVKSQCEVLTSASEYEIYCGESVDLTAFGQSSGTVILSEDFNTSGFGTGWGSTPGATSFTNPCSPGGVDGTPHAWMDNNTSVPRTLESASYDLTAATAGVTICFDLLFASQGDASPCEGPDEPDEGVYLEYSTDGGATWQTINYFDPNGGNDPQLTNWNNWCFQVPPGAITTNTIFRWHQTADSGADYDHWGIDNVQIYQNDVNAELVWLHDGYSYGVGNPGGVNPNSVTPTTTTTYTAQLTTGGGTVCTEDVTITVLDPVIDANISLNPSTICLGDCADITGDAAWVLDPGGIETYENNQLEIVASGSASVNINIQDLNMTGIEPGSIQEICINDFNFSGTELCTNFGGCNCNGTPINFGDNCNIDASSFNITVSTPDGCEITLVPSSTITTTGIQDMCFVPAGGNPISSGSGSYTGQFDPTDPFSALDGCDANGVWTLEFNTGSGGLGFGFGSLTGWNITFDDPPIEQPVNATWTPGTDLSSTNTINTQACPTSTTTYTIELDNGVAGCATYTEDFTVTVDPCNGCTPPNTIIIDPLTACNPNNVDLNDAIDATSDPANYTFHNTQADAQNDVNSIGPNVSATGSYWVRAEDPNDPTCYAEFEIEVVVTTVTYNVSLTDESCGNANGVVDLTANGGTAPYAYSIDNGNTTQATGTFSNLTAGTFDIVIIDDNGCQVTGTETLTNTAGPTFNSVVVDENCGNLDGEITLTPSGGTAPYTFSIDNGNTTQANGNFTGLSAGVYDVIITDDNGCEGTGQVSVANIGGPSIDQLIATDPSCPGACDGEMTVTASGGTPPYTYSWTDDNGNPVGGNTPTITGLCAGDYTVEVSDAAGGSSTVINSNTSFETGPGGGCDCPDTYNCGNDAGMVVDGVSPVYQVGDQGCVSSTTNYSNSLGANSGTGSVYFYAGADQISTGPFTFAGGETVELCVSYAGPQGSGPPGQNTANSHFSFGIDGAQVGPDVTVTTNQGWTQVCFTVTMTAGNHTFEILSGGAAQYSMWFDDFTITEQTGGGAGCPVSSTGSLTEPVPADATFSTTDFCEGSANSATGIVTPGGTFAFNPVPSDGATIDPTTGEVTNGVGGTTYTIEYTTPAPCSEVSTETVTVIAAPQFNVSGINPGCGSSDGQIVIDGLQANTAYDLTYSENGTIVGPQNITTDANGEIILNGLAAGSFTDFEISLNGCTTLDITVIDLVQAGAPNVSAPNDIEVCEGNGVTLIADNPDGATISWDNGVTDGAPFAGVVGTTTYTVTADLNGCTITDQVQVTVNPLPTVDAGADQTICEGESITLSGSGAQSYLWDNGVVDGDPITPSATNTYSVVGTDANGCQNVDQVTITLEPAPVVSFNGDVLTGCEPHTVNFTNTTANGSNCTWDFGDGTTAQGCAGVSHTYSNSGSYSVTLTVENASGCVGTTTLTNYVQVTGPPIADFTADPMITDITDTEVNFTNESIGGTDFTWDFGDASGELTTYDATHTFPDEESGEYIVTLIASNGPDCADTARLLIQVKDVIIFYVPNTFTPDGDEYNQTFQPIFTSGYDPQDFQLLIFNRWGEVIFESRDASIGWNGTYGGKYVKDGTYIWTIEFQETMSDKRHYHQGHVNMLR